MNILNKEKILEQARIFIEEGKLDRAIREYEKILLAEPNDLRVKLRVAELYTKRKQINDAIRIYREVADSYSTEGFYLKAVTVLKNILKLNPSMVEVNEQLAGLYEKMGLMQDAVRQYDILASALDLKGMKDRVLEIRSHIVKLNPTDGSSRVRLAELYQREGRMDDALVQYEEFARLLESSGKNNARLSEIYEKILAHSPERHDFFRKLVQIYEEEGDNKKLLAKLENYSEIVSEDPELLSLQAKLYIAQNQNELARAKYMQLAELQKDEGNIDAAIEAFFEILVILPEEEERIERRIEDLKPGVFKDLVERANARRIEIEEEVKRKEELQEQEEIEKNKSETEAKEKGKTAQAEMRAERKIEKKPEQKPAPQPELKAQAVPVRRDADAAYNLGLAYRKTGLADESAEEFKKALDIYKACIVAGDDNGEIRARVAELEGKAAPKPQPADGEKKEEVKRDFSEETSFIKITPDMTSGAEDDKKSNLQPEKKTKKKISFV